jgi:hypothetical protein
MGSFHKAQCAWDLCFPCLSLWNAGNIDMSHHTQLLIFNFYFSLSSPTILSPSTLKIHFVFNGFCVSLIFPHLSPFYSSLFRLFFWWYGGLNSGPVLARQHSTAWARPHRFLLYFSGRFSLFAWGQSQTMILPCLTISPGTIFIGFGHLLVCWAFCFLFLPFSHFPVIQTQINKETAWWCTPEILATQGGRDLWDCSLRLTP